MRILLLGKTGQLGWELERTLASLGEITAVDYPEVNLNEKRKVRGFLHQIKPQVVINATAYTAVDQAEAERESAMTVNRDGPGLLAEESLHLGAVLIHYSTDYVFDGMKGTPYVETDLPHPLNVYGESKLAGEKAVEQVGGVYLILRTSWVYSMRGESFVAKTLAWSRQQRQMKLVSDQIGNPTWCRMLAEVNAQLLAAAGQDVFTWFSARKGIYHLAGDGYANRLEWGQAILQNDLLRTEQITEEILPALTEEFPAPAQRPLFSALDCSLFYSTFGLRLPPWRIALQLAMQSK
jgi:dTDP-4-dehydrorhamnose reductase